MEESFPILFHLDLLLIAVRHVLLAPPQDTGPSRITVVRQSVHTRYRYRIRRTMEPTPLLRSEPTESTPRYIFNEDEEKFGHELFNDAFIIPPVGGVSIQ